MRSVHLLQLLLEDFFDPPFKFCPASWTPEKQIPQMAFSPHWYDLDALFRKEFGNFTVNVQALSRVSGTRAA
jgi:hypothetical protein